jgi:hypothetical protein
MSDHIVSDDSIYPFQFLMLPVTLILSHENSLNTLPPIGCLPCTLALSSFIDDSEALAAASQPTPCFVSTRSFSGSTQSLTLLTLPAAGLHIGLVIQETALSWPALSWARPRPHALTPSRPEITQIPVGLW